MITPEAKDLIDSFLNPDPIKRIGYHNIGFIKIHPFFKSYILLI
jgi:hypothetical protein